MKTIFITMFEGVESKNILRTGVVEKFLNLEQESKVVLFVKNKERAEYYAKEFSDPRILYEIVEPYQSQGIHKVFSALKFKFLQTETTDLRAKMVAEEKGMLTYYFLIISHRILARPSFVWIFRRLDALLSNNPVFDPYFHKYQPDLVFLANLFEDIEIDFLKAAKRFGTNTAALINSWDRVTARCILRTLPDKLIVFNNVIKEELVETNYVKPSDIFVSGLPQYDYYAVPISVGRDEFLRQLGIDPSYKVMFYSPIGGTFSNSDWEMIDLLYSLNNVGKFGTKVQIFVSFSPNDFIKEEELKKRPHLLYQHIGTRFSKIRSTDWDMTTKELENLKNLLYHSSLVMCYASSLSMDAALFDKPVININFEIKDNQNLSKSPTLFYGMTHYSKALKAGGIRLVNTEDELVEWVNKYLNDPSIDKESRKKMTERHCKYTDGKSAERITKFLLTLT